jgi:class 3 adenylate cyclase
MLEGLGRLVTFDRRGAGLSSHTAKPTIEVRVADIETVLTATDIDSAVLIAATLSTQAALAFAAMQPDRCRALALYAPSARSSRGPHYEIGVPDEVTRMALESVESTWGTGVTGFLYAPSLAHDNEFLTWAARTERSTATPVEAREWVEMYQETDVRHVLSHVRAPTLVATPRDAGEYFPSQSRYVADALQDARAVELAAQDLWPFGDGMGAFVAALTDFLGDVVKIEPPPATDRRLAAVLFTDLVASTQQLRDVGDRQWRTLLESHDTMAAQVVAKHRGRVVKSTGDGILAIFDGPAAAVLAAFDLSSSLRRIGLSTRAGVHVGELEHRGDDVAGIAVNLCSRVADRAAPDEVLVTTTVRDLVAGSGLRFEDRGLHDLKGLPEPIPLLAASALPAS